MPGLTDLVPLHSGQVRNFDLLDLGQVWIKLIQFCTSNWINYFKLACCLENGVGPDQLASGASWFDSRLFSAKVLSIKAGFIHSENQ